MFVHVSEDSVDHELRRGQTFCKDCENLTTIRLIERVRTVTAYWFIKSTERNHFLICDGCTAQFPVKPHNPGDLEYADIHTLLGMSGKRFVPFFARAMVFFASITVPMPLIGQLMVWAAWSNRAVLSPRWMTWIKYIFWAGLLFNAVFIAAGVIDHYFGKQPGY